MGHQRSGEKTFLRSQGSYRTDKKRREAQTQLDINLSESKKLAAQIGALMKQGKKEEAESIKTEVARLKDTNKALQEAMDRAQQELTTLLCAIPNIPYDIVPEGNGAEDNVVVKMGGMETELPKDALPHWELAKKYNLDAIHDTVHEMARDEARHGKAFAGLLKRYFGDK